MKRYTVKIEMDYGHGMYDGDVYHELVSRPDECGEWVKAKDALKLQHRIDRMQKRLDELEGRA